MGTSEGLWHLFSDLCEVGPPAVFLPIGYGGQDSSEEGVPCECVCCPYCGGAALPHTVTCVLAVWALGLLGGQPL